MGESPHPESIMRACATSPNVCWQCRRPFRRFHCCRAFDGAGLDLRSAPWSVRAAYACQHAIGIADRALEHAQAIRRPEPEALTLLYRAKDLHERVAARTMRIAK